VKAALPRQKLKMFFSEGAYVFSFRTGSALAWSHAACRPFPVTSPNGREFTTVLMAVK